MYWQVPRWYLHLKPSPWLQMYIFSCLHIISPWMSNKQLQTEMLIFFPHQPHPLRSFPHCSSWHLYPSIHSGQPSGFLLTCRLLESPSKIWRRTSNIYIQSLAISLYLPLYDPLPSSLALTAVIASSLVSSFYSCSSVVCPRPCQRDPLNQKAYHTALTDSERWTHRSIW